MASRSGRSPDYFFLAVLVILVLFGLVILASASSNLGKTQFDNTYYYLEHQLLFGLTLGAAGFCAGYFIDYHRFKKAAFILLLISIVTLILVFTPLGTKASDASRWLRLGPLSFQPAELVKLTYLLYLAAWLSNPKFKRATDFQSGLLPFLAISGIIAILLVLQPATSTVVILLASGLAVYFVDGAPVKYILLMGLVALLALAAVIAITPYRRARILGYLDQSADTQGMNYQVNQSVIAIGTGGLTGIGYGRSDTSYIPDPIDDSIFAIVGEDLGFIGAGFLIAMFCLFTFRLFWLAKKITDKFGRLILIGFGTVIALQAFVNMAAISGLVPLTGVPLPFISYGGTAFAVFLTMSGIALNISKYA